MNNSVIRPPKSAAEALEAARRIRSLQNCHFIDDDVEIVNSRFVYALTGHRQVTDIALVTLADRSGGQLVTFDGKIKAALRANDRSLVTVL